MQPKALLFVFFLENALYKTLDTLHKSMDTNFWHPNSW